MADECARLFGATMLIVKTKPFVLESTPLVTNEFRKRHGDATLRENQTSKSLVVH